MLPKDMISLSSLVDTIRNCKKCAIGNCKVVFNGSQYDPHVVYDGSFPCKILLVGQNPGMQEVRLRKPFVGPAGALLRSLLHEFSFRNYGITNTVFCYTPQNRTPSETELHNCRPYLSHLITLIRPKVVVALGNVALKRLLGEEGVMSRRGRFYSTPYSIDVFVTIHPSAALRNVELKSILVEDMRVLKNYCAEKNFV